MAPRRCQTQDAEKAVLVGAQRLDEAGALLGRLLGPAVEEAVAGEHAVHARWTGSHGRLVDHHKRQPAVALEGYRSWKAMIAAFCSVVQWRRERLELDIGLLAAGDVPRRADRLVPVDAAHRLALEQSMRQWRRPRGCGPQESHIMASAAGAGAACIAVTRVTVTLQLQGRAIAFFEARAQELPARAGAAVVRGGARGCPDHRPAREYDPEPVLRPGRAVRGTSAVRRAVRRRADWPVRPGSPGAFLEARVHARPIPVHESVLASRAHYGSRGTLWEIH